MNVRTNPMRLVALAFLLSSVFVSAQTSDTGEARGVASQTETNAVDLVTRSGERYRTVSILRAEPDSLVIRHAGGVARILMDDAPEALQKQYGYDPAAAAETKRQQAQAEAARRAAAEAPLDGQDLVAWKLARQAAETKCKQLSTPHQMRVPYQAATRGSAADYAIRANAQFAAQHPTYAVAAEPQRRFMSKTSTGDWTFIIPVKASYYNVQKKARVPAWERMLVKVTNYGTEIRVEDARLDSK